MQLKELTIFEFNEFEKKHYLSNYAQTINYALLMTEYGFEYELIGLCDEDKIVAASLILYKKYNSISIGYAPKGFLIDYKNTDLLKKFTKAIKDYYYKRKFALIKINPEIPISLINNKTFEKISTDNTSVKNELINMGYSKLKDNLYFESMFPRFNAFVNLQSYKSENLLKNTKNKIKKGIRKGLTFEKVDKEHITYLNEFLKKDNFFYKDLFNTFSKEEKADLFIVSLNTEKYLENAQNFYAKEAEKNQYFNEKMIEKSHARNINKKMNSDIALLSYKKDIMEASKLIDEPNKIILGAALVVKHNKTVKIVASGYDYKYKRFVPNYFMHYNIIKFYRKDYNLLDLNGISGDFSSTSPFKGLNEFKLGFNPAICEFIGEFDLIIAPKAYKYLMKLGVLAKTFKEKY